MSAQQTDIGDRRAEARTGIPLRSAVLAFLVFYAAAALLNGRHLHEAASRRAYGPTRTAWMTATAPLRMAAVTLRLDRVRAWFEPFQEESP